MQAYYLDDEESMASPSYLKRNKRGQFQQRGLVRRVAGGTASLFMTLIKLLGFFSVLIGFFVAFMIFFPDHQATVWVADKLREYEVPIPEKVKDKVLPTTTPAPKPMMSSFFDFLVDVLIVLAVMGALSFLIQAVHQNVLNLDLEDDKMKMYYGFEMALIVIAVAVVIMTKNDTSIGKWLLLLALVLSAAAILRVQFSGNGVSAKDNAINTGMAMGLLALLIIFFRAITGFVQNFLMTIVPYIRSVFWIIVVFVASVLIWTIFDAIKERSNNVIKLGSPEIN